MVNSIVPGDSTFIEIYGFMCTFNNPYKIKLPNNTEVESSQIMIGYYDNQVYPPLGNYNGYDNVLFKQTEALAEQGISVTPYGLIIIPKSTSLTFPIEIPIKCCNKTGTLTITQALFNELVSAGGCRFTVQLTTQT